MSLPPCSIQMDAPFQVMDYVSRFGHTGKGTPLITKIIKNPLDKEIKESLWYNVLSKRLLEKPSNILVKGESGKLYPFKIRPNYDTVPLSAYVEYNEIHNMYHDYKEIVGKFIIIDKTQFNSKGRRTLSEF